MARAKAILQSEFPYHITARCINQEWFFIPMDVVWEIFSLELHMTAINYNLKIHSFILMSNHFHLIASTPKSNVSQCMHAFMSNVSRRLNESGNRINETFAGRHYKTILNHPNYYLNAYKYLYRNSVDAGLSDKVESYPYSSLYYLLGQGRIGFPVLEDHTLFFDVEGTLSWLNRKPDKEKNEAVRYALKRPYFTSTKCRSRGDRVLDLEDII